MTNPKALYEIYTDGSVDPKNGRGSWAYVMIQNGEFTCEAFGRENKTDSNRMEIQAAIKALSGLPAASDVVLYSDSRVLIDGITLNVSGWKDNGWIKDSGRAIPNLDLFMALEALSRRHSIRWVWVKAHSGVYYNERCDELCTQARTQRSTAA